MKAGASTINAHIALGQTTLARILKVTRAADGAVYGFTDHDVDLVFGGVTYLSTTSFNPFNVSDKPSTQGSDTELTGAFDSVITRADVLADLWDNSPFQLMRVIWANLSGGAIIDVTGSFGEFEPQEFGFRTALHGLEYPLTFVAGDICGPLCPVDFMSPRCAPSGSLADGTTVNSLIQSATVTSTDGVRTLVVSGLTNTGKPFDGGLVTFSTGNNPTLSAEIWHLDFATSTIILRPWTQIGPIQVTDTLKVAPRCSKIFSECSVVWLNGLNFQNAPHAPGPDNVLSYPDYVAPHG